MLGYRKQKGTGCICQIQRRSCNSVSLNIWTSIFNYGGDPTWNGSNDAFNAVKVSSGNDYIAAGYTNALDGDVTGFHGVYEGPVDFWVVKLQALNRIIGSVFIDQNNNGVKDPGELPYMHGSVKSTGAGSQQTSIPYKVLI